MKKTVKRSLIFVSALFVLAATIPLLVDVNRFRPEIEEKVQSALGRSFKVGKISLALLPYPSVKIKDIRIGNPQGFSSDAMITISQARATLDFLPLFKKQIRISHVSLQDPHISLEKKAGQGNWVFDFARETATSKDPKDKDANATSSQNNKTFDLNIDRVDLVNGHLVYTDGDQTHEVSKLSTTTHLENLQGPLIFTGYANFKGFDWQFDGKIQELMSESIPIKVSFDTVGSEFSLEGKISTSEKMFKGTLDTRWDFDALSGLVTIPEHLVPFLKEALQLRAYMILSPNLLNFQNVELLLDGQKISGLVKVKMDPFSAKGDLRGFPGGTSLSVMVQPEKNKTSGHFSFDSSHPKKFLAWLRVPFSMDGDLSSRLTIKSGLVYQNETLSLNQFQTEYKKALLQGKAAVDLKKKSLTYDLSMQQILPLLGLFDIKLKKDPGKIVLKGSGKMKDDTNFHTETKISLSSGDFRGELESNNTKGLSHQGKIYLNLNDPGSFFALFSQDTSSFPVKKLSLTSLLNAQGETMGLRDLKVQIHLQKDHLTLQGFVEKKGRVIQAEVQSDHMKTRSFFPEEKAQAQGSGKSDPKGSNEVSGKRWSTDPIDLQFLNDRDLKVDFKLKNLRHQDWSIEDIKGSLTAKEGLLVWDQHQGRCFGGNLVSRLSIKTGSSHDLALEAALKDADLKRATASNEGKIKITKGNVTAVVNVKTKGRSLKDFVSHLSGEASLKASKGALQGFDLKGASQALKNTKNLEGVLSLLSKEFSKGVTHFESVSALCQFTDGVGTLKDTFVIADGGEGNAQGTVQLVPYTLDIAGTFKLSAHPNLPPFKLLVFGSIDEPRKKLDYGDLRDYLLKNVFQSLVKSKNPKEALGSLLSGVLGGDKSSKQPAQNANEKSKESNAQGDPKKSSPTTKDILKEPEKAIQNVLKGLF